MTLGLCYIIKTLFIITEKYYVEISDQLDFDQKEVIEQ